MNKNIYIFIIIILEKKSRLFLQLKLYCEQLKYYPEIDNIIERSIMLLTSTTHLTPDLLM